MIYAPVLLALYSLSSTPFANLQLDRLVEKTFIAETILKTLTYECEYDDFFQHIKEFVVTHPVVRTGLSNQLSFLVNWGSDPETVNAFFKGLHAKGNVHPKERGEGGKD